MPYKSFEIVLSDISKHNKTRDTLANLLMITDSENSWHYLPIRSIPRLLHGVTSTYKSEFYCLNFFHSYRTLKALKNHEKLW